MHKLLGMILGLGYTKAEVYIIKDIKEKIGDPIDLIGKEKNKELF